MNEPVVDATILSYLLFSVGAYYLVLFSVSLVAPAAVSSRSDPVRPFFVIVIPARDEELVVGETLESLLRLDYEDYLVLVMNDGSSDATSAIASSFAGSGRVMVVDRPPEVAGKGKGDVLNHAYRVTLDLTTGAAPPGDLPVERFSSDRIVVCVLDADGQLERQTLGVVAPLFDDPEVGAAQIAVRVANAGEGLLARLQDMEFVGFSVFVQRARDRFGSVGLGGNGQFTRLSALLGMGRDPWTRCLTEDLDLGLSLIEQGWRVRFTAATCVAQQGLHSPRLLLRQRTRWVQGHYQCWRHLRPLFTTPGIPMGTRLDLAIYLLLVTYVVCTLVNALLLLGVTAGAFTVRTQFLSVVPAPARTVVQQVLAFAPVVVFLLTYQRFGRRVQNWQLPGFAVAFTAYSYVWLFATCRAWARILIGRGNWAKTPRALPRASVGA